MIYMRKTPSYFVQNLLTRIWFKKSEEVRSEIKDIIENTENHFNPEKTNFVDLEWLKLILEWKIFNPKGKYKVDYNFFVICSNWLDNIPSKFDIDSIELCYSSNWFWQFSCEDNSMIIFPDKWTFSFNSKSKIYIQDEYKWNIWNWWWFFQLDKNIYTKIIQTNVWVEELQKLLDTYK